MTIVDARIKVSFTPDEKEAMNTVVHIFEKLNVSNALAFLVAYTDGDWVCYDDGNRTFEFEDNRSDDYDPSEDDF